MTIESLKALCEKATDGPWASHQSHIYAPDGEIIAVINNPGAFETDYPIEANRDLIVALRNNAAALIEVAEAAKELTRDCHYCGGAGTVTIMSTGSELIRGKIVPIPTAKREEPCQYCGDVRAALSKLEAP